MFLDVSDGVTETLNIEHAVKGLRRVLSLDQQIVDTRRS